MNDPDGPEPREAVRLDPAFAGEILGSAVRISHPGLGPTPIEGTLVDESLRMLVVRRAPGGRLVRIPKSGTTGTIELDGRLLPLSGAALSFRPEDRTKRVGLRGGRR